MLRAATRRPSAAYRGHAPRTPDCLLGLLGGSRAQVAEGTEQARRDRNAMALAVWALLDGMVHLAAGRLAAARGTVNPCPARMGDATELDMSACSFWLRWPRAQMTESCCKSGG